MFCYNHTNKLYQFIYIIISYMISTTSWLRPASDYQTVALYFSSTAPKFWIVSNILIVWITQSACLKPNPISQIFNFNYTFVIILSIFCDFRPYFIRHPLQSMPRSLIGQTLRNLRLRWLCRILQAVHPSQSSIFLQGQIWGWMHGWQDPQKPMQSLQAEKMHWSWHEQRR